MIDQRFIRMIVNAALDTFHEEAQNKVLGVETSDINVNKQWKPRRLKTDSVHRLARQVYKLKAKNPTLKRKRQVYQKLYRRKNKIALHRRSKKVNQMKQHLHHARLEQEFAHELKNLNPLI